MCGAIPSVRNQFVLHKWITTGSVNLFISLHMGHAVLRDKQKQFGVSLLCKSGHVDEKENPLCCGLYFLQLVKPQVHLGNVSAAPSKDEHFRALCQNCLRKGHRKLNHVKSVCLHTKNKHLWAFSQDPTCTAIQQNQSADLRDYEEVVKSRSKWGLGLSSSAI